MQEAGFSIAPFLMVQAAWRFHSFIHVLILFRHLADCFECLDASRPWLCYWILHSFSLLHSPVSRDVANDVIDFLSRCQSPQGGFGGVFIVSTGSEEWG